MKTLLSRVAVTGLSLLAAVALSSSAIAGPGPQYWQQQEKIRAENAAKKAQAAAPATQHDHAAMACAACKTSLVTEFSPTNVSGKWAPSYKPVGSKHECSTCGGAITRIRGQVTNDMKSNCPICAKAKAENAACCSLSS